MQDEKKEASYIIRWFRSGSMVVGIGAHKRGAVSKEGG